MHYRLMRILIFVFLSVSLLGACASTPEAKNIAYTCDRGTNFIVNYTKKGFTTMRNGKNGIHRYEVKNIAANITLADGTLLTLPVQKIASGFMFSDGIYAFSGKGNKVSWAVGRMLAEQCEISN